MRILPLSDLHLEIWKEFGPKYDLTISRPDVVILAGDIATGSNAVQWAARNFGGIPVLYVHGNHEAYGKNLEDVQKDIAEACRETDNVHFLNCGEIRLGTIRFLGATLWTDYRLFGEEKRIRAIQEAEQVMNDYRRIRLANSGYRKLRATDTIKFHINHRQWLVEKFQEPFSGKTVVISHMAPSMQSVSPRYQEDLVSAAYASNLDEIAAHASLWVHGHMHESFDYQIGQCRVVCNPCGYMKRYGGFENPNFGQNQIIVL